MAKTFEDILDLINRIRINESKYFKEIDKILGKISLDEYKNYPLGYGSISIGIFNGDREQFPPHVHVWDGNPNNPISFHIEINLENGNIINVKKPKNAPCNWSILDSKSSKYIQANIKSNKLIYFQQWLLGNPENQHAEIAVKELNYEINLTENEAKIYKASIDILKRKFPNLKILIFDENGDLISD